MKKKKYNENLIQSCDTYNREIILLVKSTLSFLFLFFLKNDRYAFGHIINRSMNNKIEIQEYSCI